MKKISFIIFLFVFYALPAWTATPDYLIVQTASPTNFSNGDTITFELVAFNNTDVSKILRLSTPFQQG